MDRNREITRIKREEIRRLKEHLTLLQQRLERWAGLLHTHTPLFTIVGWSTIKGMVFIDTISVLLLTKYLALLLLFHWKIHSQYGLSSSLCSALSLSLSVSPRYLSYGSGPKRFPLADVLQYAMEFTSSKPVCTSPVGDIDTSAPPGGTTGQLLPASRQVMKHRACHTLSPCVRI